MRGFLTKELGMQRVAWILAIVALGCGSGSESSNGSGGKDGGGGAGGTSTGGSSTGGASTGGSSTGGTSTGGTSTGGTSTGGTSTGGTSTGGTSTGGTSTGGAAGAGATGGAAGAPSDTACDDFERPSLGSDWTVIYPPAPNSQVQIIDSSDLGMGPGPQGFFIVNWTKQTFSADQFCEATIPADATAGWAHGVSVRWRASDSARYMLAYDNDPNQPLYGNWILKYDGVPGPQTRIIANIASTAEPQPGDTLRIEVQGYTLRGYLNGTKVLEGADTDASKIADGPPGLAARWANGNTSTAANAKVWESWCGGSL
jgi:hypothetical protein